MRAEGQDAGGRAGPLTTAAVTAAVTTGLAGPLPGLQLLTEASDHELRACLSESRSLACGDSPTLALRLSFRLAGFGAMKLTSGLNTLYQIFRPLEARRSTCFRFLLCCLAMAYMPVRALGSDDSKNSRNNCIFINSFKGFETVVLFWNLKKVQLFSRFETVVLFWNLKKAQLFSRFIMARQKQMCFRRYTSSPAPLPDVFTDLERNQKTLHVCAICDDGGDLVFYDGICMRHFHRNNHSLGARENGCETVNLSDYHTGEWKCYECVNKMATCVQCYMHGPIENSHDSELEVRQCPEPYCTRFLCITCLPLESQNVCPAHYCDLCKLYEGDDMVYCVRCPKAWHKLCLDGAQES